MDDLISRQEAIDAVENCEPGEELFMIESLPSIDAVKRGEWIATHERTIFSNPDSITYVCSECGYKIYTIYGMPSTTTYCPSCGSRMEGGNDETN